MRLLGMNINSADPIFDNALWLALFLLWPGVLGIAAGLGLSAWIAWPIASFWHFALTAFLALFLSGGFVVAWIIWLTVYADDAANGGGG